MPKPESCSAKPPWYLSCSNLIPRESIKITFIMMSTLVFVASLLSIIIHVLNEKSSKAFSLTVIGLNVTDLILVLYLKLVWISDIILGDTFFISEKTWRSSNTCFTAMFLVLIFTFATQLFITFLSFSRLRLVLNPVETHLKSTKFVLKSILCMSLVAFIISLLIGIGIKLTMDSLPTSLCLPFIDPLNYFIVIKLIVWIVAISQLITSVAVILMHVLLVKALINSQKKINISKSKPGTSNTYIIMQLFIITVSNMICWFPTNIIYITAMFLERYSTNLIIWTTVVAMPINSIINPVVFIIVACRKYLKFRTKTI